MLAQFRITLAKRVATFDYEFAPELQVEASQQKRHLLYYRHQDSATPQIQIGEIMGTTTVRVRLRWRIGDSGSSIGLEAAPALDNSTVYGPGSRTAVKPIYSSPVILPPAPMYRAAWFTRLGTVVMGSSSYRDGNDMLYNMARQAEWPALCVTMGQVH